MKRTQLTDAKDYMAANGWTYILSVMADVKDGTNYGLLYTKAGRKFYLNFETIDNLPVD